MDLNQEVRNLANSALLLVPLEAECVDGVPPAGLLLLYHLPVEAALLTHTHSAHQQDITGNTYRMYKVNTVMYCIV